MRRLQVVLPLFLSFGSPLLFADQVAFKNGDRLTGAILKSDTKNLVIRTAVAGEVTVSWLEIHEIRSDLPLYVGLADGKIIVGRVTTQDGRLEIATNSGATVETPKENVVALRNEAEQLAHQKSQRPGLLHGWDGGVDAGLELTRPST